MKKIKLVLAAVLAFLTLGVSGVQAQAVSHPHYNVKRVLRHKKHVRKHSRRKHVAKKHAKKRHASRKARRHHKVVLNGYPYTQRYLEKKVGRRHWTCAGGTFGGAHGYTGNNPLNAYIDGKGHYYYVYRNGVIKKEKGYKFVTIYRP